MAQVIHLPRGIARMYAVAKPEQRRAILAYLRRHCTTGVQLCA